MKDSAKFGVAKRKKRKEGEKQVTILMDPEQTHRNGNSICLASPVVVISRISFRRGYILSFGHMAERKAKKKKKVFYYLHHIILHT